MTDPATFQDMTDGTETTVVRDGDREIRFTGDLLGFATSKAPYKDRWIEHSIYKTVGGTYILATVGHSTREGETTRYTATVSETPEGVIETLYLYDEDQVRYLTRVARKLLDIASERDAGLARAFAVEEVA